MTVPAIVATEIKDVANRVTYGWGMIPVTATVATTTWTTSLFPKDGLYLVPLKAKIRDAHDIAIGDVLEIALRIGN